MTTTARHADAVVEPSAPSAAAALTAEGITQVFAPLAGTARISALDNSI